MAVKQKIIKEDKFEFNVNFSKIWQTLQAHAPEILTQPLKLANTLLKYANQLFT